MQAFEYRKPRSVAEAVTAAAAPHARFVAGGTTLVDLMKLNVETPQLVIDINSLPLDKIERMADGGLRIGAMVRNSDLAHDKTVEQEYAVLSQALLSGASGQLRNMASTGGNLLQRTRCYYFRDPIYACNKREPGTGCAALDGYNRIHAILGTSQHCIATHPSDMAVAMMALEAVVHVSGPKGERSVPLNDFYVLPGNTPHVENVLGAGELITYVTIPKLPSGTKSYYLKRRDRASYEFALASAAVIANVQGGMFRYVRIALGGIGTKPWRSLEAERLLQGKSASAANFRAAAEAALRGAKPMHDNVFKVELAKRTLIRGLQTVTQSA
jgi:xanthine dehydrogenase YagS FAD-binding subunit